MRKSKLETAKILAKAHFEVEPNLKHVYILEPVKEHGQGNPIILLEVVAGTLERGIEPIAFTADLAHGIEYPSVIVEISPSEFQRIQNRTLRYGTHQWTIGEELQAN